MRNILILGSFFIALTGLASLGGCGSKGPLTLPPPATQQPAAAPGTPGSAVDHSTPGGAPR